MLGPVRKPDFIMDRYFTSQYERTHEAERMASILVL